MPVSRLLLAFLIFASTPALRAAQQWTVEELILAATQPPPAALPAIDVRVTAEFTAPDARVIRVNGFWDGDATWRVRFTPTVPGAWTYRIRAEPALAGLAREGTLAVAPAAPKARGFLRRDPEFPSSFSFDSRERFFMWGNTVYNVVATTQLTAEWRAGFAAMRATGLNKLRIRIGSIPAHEKGGLHPASPAFVDHDTARPNLAHWRAVDEVVRADGSQASR